MTSPPRGNPVSRALEASASILFGPTVWSGPGLRRSLSLTFDDGPSPATADIAAYLASMDIQATFFLCGKNVLRHPHLARALVDAGHEVGNHTFSHRSLRPRLGWQPNLLSADAVYQEFARAQDVIEQCTGTAPRLLRPPYGLRWFGLKAVGERLGLRSILWTAMGHDWEWPAERVVSHVIETATPGGIVCLHDGRDTQPHPDVSVTCRALRLLVPRLRQQGYAFETVSDLLRSSPPGTSPCRPLPTYPENGSTGCI